MSWQTARDAKALRPAASPCCAGGFVHAVPPGWRCGVCGKALIIARTDEGEYVVVAASVTP